MSLLAATLAVTFFAQTTATLNSDGSVRITRDGQPLASLAPIVARAGWTFVGFTSAGKPGTISGNIPGGKINGKVTFTAAPVGAEYVFEATPTTDLNIETAGLSLTFGADWAGGMFGTNDQPGSSPTAGGVSAQPLPASFKDQDLFRGKVGTGIVSSGNRHVWFQVAGNPVNAHLQDSRGFGAGFDFRIGIPDGPEVWPKGQTRRYSTIVGTKEPLQVQTAKPLTIEAGPDWIPLEPHLDVVKGSALDWAPKKIESAGSKGWVIATKDGHFAFEKEPTKPVRFYGANLAFSAAFPDKPAAEALAERLMRLGYNTIRLHHFDAALTGGYAEGPGKSTVLDADVLDKMEYLVAEMKKRGIYTTLDFYTIRKIRRDEIVPGDVGMDEAKGLFLISEKARENWWEFTRGILEHTNPYTGLKWKDDPAIPWLAVVNENSAGHVFRNAGPETKKLLNEAWQKAGNSGEFTYDTDAGALFGVKLHEDAYTWMKAKIRSIGSKALLTDVNGWHEQTALTHHRENLDYVDNHDYWDHPSFLGGDWGLPSRGWSGGGSAVKALGGGIVNKSLSRVKGLPFSISEFNFTAPNRYRGEGGLLMGAIAARQDWDAMWRFAWSHNQANIKGPQPLDYFNIGSDPAMLASERAIVALFLRQDMPPTRDEKIVKITPGSKGYSAPVTQQLLHVRVYGSTKEGEPSGKEVNLLRYAPVVSADREKGILRVMTPRTAGVVAPAGENVEAGAIKATLGGHSGSLWASSVDGKPLASSDRVLVTHITDVQNTGIRYAAQDRDVLLAWGSLPWLVRAGTAKITLQVDRPEEVEVWRLDMAGRRVEKMAARKGAGKVEFEATVKGPKGATLYYELAR